MYWRKQYNSVGKNRISRSIWTSQQKADRKRGECTA